MPEPVGRVRVEMREGAFRLEGVPSAYHREPTDAQKSPARVLQKPVHLLSTLRKSVSMMVCSGGKIHSP